MPFTAPADVIAELEKRKKNVPDFADAFNKNATQLFIDAVAYRLGRGGNVYIYIFGRNNSGKSISAQTITIKVIIRIFQILGYQMEIWQDIAVTRDNSQSLEAFAQRMKSQRSNTPIIVIQDENEELSGHDRIYAMKNMISELKAMRSTHHCYILITLDHYKQALKMENKITSLGFIILETIDQDIKGEFDGINRLVFHSLEGPHGMLYVDHHGNKKFVSWYEDLKQKANERLLAAGGAAAAQGDLMALAKKIHDETIQQIEDTSHLSAADFRAIARKMEGENKIYGTTDKLKDASQLAWRILYQGQKGRPEESSSPVPESPSLPIDIDPDPEPVEKLPAEDYEALRQIAYEEFRKAIPNIKDEIILEAREYYYPLDSLTQEADWTYHDVKEALNIPLRVESVGKNIRFFKKDIGNKPVEQIGIRFVKWKLEHTPDLPTQTSLGGGPGERDISFTVQDIAPKGDGIPSDRRQYDVPAAPSGRNPAKFVASANVKHFLDNVIRPIHLAPEFQDAVHYAIVLRVKPFRLQVYRGTGQEYLNLGPTGGEQDKSVWDLGWTGFIEDLRREAEKVKPT